MVRNTKVKMHTETVSVPSFSSTVIQDKRSDGYWIQAIHFDKDDKVPGLVASGLASGVVEFLENPKAVGNDGKEGKQVDIADAGLWKKYEVGKFDSPVAVMTADITGNGLTDIVICHDYGPIMLQCNPDGGWITWLENPGRDKLGDGPWKQRKIGRWPAMHRLQSGHFTQRSFLEIVAASVVRGPHDKTTPIPIIRFQRPADPRNAREWPHDVIDDENFTIIHDILPKKLHGPNGLDSLLVASREGLSWLYYKDSKWQHELIGAGEPQAPWQTETSETPGTGDHWGTGAMDVGRVGNDPYAYVATMEPFHGVSVAVYTKTERGLNSCKWKRHVLDNFGTPNQNQKKGDGPGHFVVCADFDGDGDDEFLVSLMGSLDRDENGDAVPASGGPNPNKGILYYKPIDVEKGVFAKFKIATESSARLALGNFGGNGKIDIASISYNVPKYYEEPNPVVTMHLNEFASPRDVGVKPSLVPSVWDNEGIVYVADPATVGESAAMPLIEVANYAISVETWPPRSRVPVCAGEGVKVLYGTLQDSHGVRRPLGGAPFPALAPLTTTTTTTTMGDSHFLTTGDDGKGAVVLRLKPIATTRSPGPDPSVEADWEDVTVCSSSSSKTEWASAEEVPVRTVFDASSAGVRLPRQRFVKVEDLWWGKGFKGVDFWNLSGFHLRFLESKKNLAHLQFWVAGPNVNCGTHNHSQDYFEEVHIGLSCGSETGGMSRIKPKYEGCSQEEVNKLPESAYMHIAVPPLHEHGGIWHRDSYGKAVRGKNNVVSYPWHKWQAGSGGNVDVWLALEFNPDLPF